MNGTDHTDPLPSLCAICVKTLKKSNYLKTNEHLLRIYTRLDGGNPSFQEIYDVALKELSSRYPMLLHKYGAEEMKLVFREEDRALFEKNLKEEEEIKHRFAYLKGEVIERESFVDKLDPRPDGTYPLEALLQGVMWPKGIDVAKREQYLSETEFQRIFKMSKDEFNKKDKHFRLRMKKEHGLF
jgi:hypothetical protein